MGKEQPGVFTDGVDPLSDWQQGDDEIIAVGDPIPHVVRVEAVGPLTLSVAFDNGTAGEVRFDDSFLIGMFAKLRDPAFFRQVGIRYGAVSWPNEEPDMCPDTLHDQIVANGGKLVLQRTQAA